jgi:hypothetical protein
VDTKIPNLQALRGFYGGLRIVAEKLLVPLAGIEPALLAELDFESSASTNSATGAFRDLGRTARVGKPAEYSGRHLPVNPRWALRMNHLHRADDPAKHPSVIEATSTAPSAQDTTLAHRRST